MGNFKLYKGTEGDYLSLIHICYEIITSPEEFSNVREALEKEGIKMAEAEVTMIPQNYVELSDEDAIKKMNIIIDRLDEDEDVQQVYHNWDE